MYVEEHILVLISTTKKYGIITTDEKIATNQSLDEIQPLS